MNNLFLFACLQITAQIYSLTTLCIIYSILSALKCYIGTLVHRGCNTILNNPLLHFTYWAKRKYGSRGKSSFLFMSMTTRLKLAPKIHVLPLSFQKIFSKKANKDQELVQSSATPDSGYQWESDNVTIRHHKRELRGQPFPSR